MLLQYSSLFPFPSFNVSIIMHIISINVPSPTIYCLIITLASLIIFLDYYSFAPSHLLYANMFYLLYVYMLEVSYIHIVLCHCLLKSIMKIKGEIWWGFFYNCMIIIDRLFCFLMWTQIATWCQLLSTWRTSLSISCQADLLATNSLFLFI